MKLAFLFRQFNLVYLWNFGAREQALIMLEETKTFKPYEIIFSAPTNLKDSYEKGWRHYKLKKL